MAPVGADFTTCTTRGSIGLYDAFIPDEPGFSDSDPFLLIKIQKADGAAGTEPGAEIAVEFAAAPVEIHEGHAESFHSILTEGGRLKDITRATADTEGAGSAFGQEAVSAAGSRRDSGPGGDAGWPGSLFRPEYCR